MRMVNTADHCVCGHGGDDCWNCVAAIAVDAIIVVAAAVVVVVDVVAAVVVGDSCGYAVAVGDGGR